MLVLSHGVSTFAQQPLWKELYSKVVTLHQQGRYGEAAKVAEEAVTVAEKTFGPHHPYMATYLNNLAAVYQAQGKYSEAEPLYKQVMAIMEKALGTDHPLVAAVCENMAEFYRQIGREDEAERLEARAGKIRSKP